MDDKIVEEHIIKTANAMGRIEEHMKNTDDTLEKMDISLSHKATKKDLRHLEKKVCSHQEMMFNPKKPCPAVENAVGQHVKTMHPSKEEEVGRKILNAKEWFKGHKTQTLGIAVISFLLSLLGIDMSGVFG